MRATIHYVDGDTVSCSPDLWHVLRSEGVDVIVLENEAGTTTLQGHSAYWLYREDSDWVAGQASFGYNKVIPPEIIFRPDGTQSTRNIEFVPDLHRVDVKLGWWR